MMIAAFRIWKELPVRIPSLSAEYAILDDALYAPGESAGQE